MNFFRRRRAANANRVDSDGVTLLMKAARDGDVDRVLTLISDGADVNATCNDGSSALMSAALGGDEECVKALTSFGAKVNARNLQGTTALMMAVSSLGNVECVRALIVAGADVNATDNDGRTAIEVAALIGVDCLGLLLESGAVVPTANPVIGMIIEVALALAVADGRMRPPLRGR